METLPYYALHRLAGDRWEIVAPDDDPTRPPWRRIAICEATYTLDPATPTNPKTPKAARETELAAFG
jgi:hypothetical protein